MENRRWHVMNVKQELNPNQRRRRSERIVCMFHVKNFLPSYISVHFARFLVFYEYCTHDALNANGPLSLEPVNSAFAFVRKRTTPVVAMFAKQPTTVDPPVLHVGTITSKATPGRKPLGRGTVVKSPPPNV